MSRIHVINSWVGGYDLQGHDSYSGEQLGNRKSESVEFKTERHKHYANNPAMWEGVNLFNRDGSANINAFSDGAIAERNNGKSSSLPAIIQIEKHPRAILPGEHRLEALDNRELACWRLYQRGEFTEQDWLEEKASIDAQREREWHIYDKMFVNK